MKTQPAAKRPWSLAPSGSVGFPVTVSQLGWDTHKVSHTTCRSSLPFPGGTGGGNLATLLRSCGILGPFRGFAQNFIHTRKERAPQAALSGRDPLSCFSKCFFTSRQPLRTISILPWPPKHSVMWLLPPCHLVPAALVWKELPPLSSHPPCTSHLSATAGAPRSVTDVSPWRAPVSTAPRAQVAAPVGGHTPVPL